MSDKIDPVKITDFNRTDRQLEAFWLFCICVAGKNADQTAVKVAALIKDVPQDVSILRWLATDADLFLRLAAVRMGQYLRIQRAISESAELNLRTATVEELEAVHGIGPKTARFFLLHSRPGVEVAVLDTHILRWIREKTYFPAPASTPAKGNKYSYWESIALSLIRSIYPGLSVAEADLLIWTTMSGRLTNDAPVA
jgi:thermostable 8-oxoguanine DNA glycosylase